jgi:hypothetical protein
VVEYFVFVLPEQQGKSAAPAARLMLRCITASPQASLALLAGAPLLRRALAADIGQVRHSLFCYAPQCCCLVTSSLEDTVLQWL